MATILTKAIITNAKGAVDTYNTTAAKLYTDLETELKMLIGTNFSGDAANGYQTFFTNQVKPALTDNLTAANTSLMGSIKGILDSIESQLLDTVDPKLGENNQNPGAAQ